MVCCAPSIFFYVSLTTKTFYVHYLLLFLSISISSSPTHGWPCCCSLKKKRKKGRKTKVLWRGEKEEKEPKKKKIERSDAVVGQLAWREEEKKNERILVYLGLNYFDAIFDFLLKYWLGIGGCKMEGLHLLLTKVKLFYNLSFFDCLGLLVSYYTTKKNQEI